MDILTTLLSSVFTGGATGLLGLGISAFVKLKEISELNRHKESMAKIDKETMEAEANLAIRKVEIEGDIQQNIETTKAISAALSASYDHDKRAYATGKLGWFGRFMMVLVDFWRGIIRPGLTTYLVVLTSVMFYEMLDILNGLEAAFNADDAIGIVKQIVAMVLYLTSTCVTWWFGGRQMEKQSVK
ncbi:MAG: hypothetical protein OEY89_15985 [Gammaproteobacteria bacterium]|nr:hypothetical protein [Gammaproteobacteria bacterium]